MGRDTTPAMLEHKAEIQYRYEKTAAGGRIRIIAKNREAVLAVQDFLRSHMTKPAKNGDVVFDYVGNTPLIVVPVLINNHGPYRFLLDTGANRTILSTAIADSRHRAFFDRAGEVRQVWARQADGTLFYLADGAVDDDVRAAAHTGRLTCPYPGCPAPELITWTATST